MIAKFKVGDKVRICNTGKGSSYYDVVGGFSKYMTECEGKICTIHNIDYDYHRDASNVIAYRVVNYDYDDIDCDWVWDERFLELEIPVSAPIVSNEIDNLQNVGHEDLGIKLIDKSRLEAIQNQVYELAGVVADLKHVHNLDDDVIFRTLQCVQETLNSLGK